jgi:cell division protein FtsB
MKQEENKWYRFFYSRWFFLAVIVLFFVILFAFLKSYYQDYQVRQEIKKLEQETKDLETKKIESLELLKYVQSDDFAEEKARLEFNMRSPEENVAVVLGGEADGSGSLQEKQDVIKLEKASNPQKWLRIFINH